MPIGDSKILIGIVIGAIAGLLIALGTFQMNHAAPIDDEGSSEGNTTIINVYRGYYGMEIAEIYYFLDVEHRIYPDTIVVEGHSNVVLFLDYTLNFDTPGNWDVQPSDDLQLIIEVPRMPSNCSIESQLAFQSDYANREFYVTVTFYNPNDIAWNVGRPMVKILGLVLGQPSTSDNNTPELQVVIEMNIT